MAQGPQSTTERKILPAACNKAIPATQCLDWHVHGRIPDSKMGGNGTTCRLRCPNHDDHKESLVISAGDPLALVLHCHACGEDARLEVRAALIRVYKLNPKCLPMTKQERVQQEEMIEAVFTSPFTPCTRLVCVRAILDGMRGVLPAAPALLELGGRAGVSRRSAFRARDELAGASLDHMFVPKMSDGVKDPKVVSAFRESASVPDRHPMPDRHSPQSGFSARLAPDKPAA